MSLSIFSFGKRDSSKAAASAATASAAVGKATVEGATMRDVPQQAQSSVAVAEARDMRQNETYEMPRKMILDLENLTPETLEAFFPSERTFERARTAA